MITMGCETAVQALCSTTRINTEIFGVCEPFKSKKQIKENCGHIEWKSVSLEEALSILDEGLLPNPSAEDLGCILRKCRKEKNPALYVLALHDHIEKLGFRSHTSIGNHLVSMLVDTGNIFRAQQVFDELGYRMKSSLNSLITGYIKNGHPEHALRLYYRIQQEDISHVTAESYIALLKACTILSDHETIYRIHDHISNRGLLKNDYFLGSALIDAYVKCSLLDKAQEVFDKLPVRDAVSWNTIISGYAAHGYGEMVRNCFEEMQAEGVSPTAVTYICILKACSSLGTKDDGLKVHSEVIKKGFDVGLHIGSALVGMYAKCGLFEAAEEIMNKLACRNVVSWTALMKGYVEHGHFLEALSCNNQMQKEGLSPDVVTFTCTLNACANIEAIHEGIGMHAEILRRGLEEDALISHALIEMYAKCGFIQRAQEVFNRIKVRGVPLWDALITGYAEQAYGEEALRCFDQMQDESSPLSAFTFISILKACTSMSDLDKGREMHVEISRRGLDRNLPVASALIDMYSKCGSLAYAQEVFDSISTHDVISWTALITGYAEYGYVEEALCLFQQMKCESIIPSTITLSYMLKACANSGLLEKGLEMHREISINGCLEEDLAVGNALIDMYAKCGFSARAQEVFDKLVMCDIVSWNTLMYGYAQLGESEIVFRLLETMVGQGLPLNSVTFVNVLNVCTHAGLVDDGHILFKLLSTECNMLPSLEHYTCMVDLLGRAGQLEKAVHMIRKMELDPDIVVWHTLLGTCQKWGNMEVARNVFQLAFKLNGMDSTAYVSLSNIYSGVYDS